MSIEIPYFEESVRDVMEYLLADVKREHDKYQNAKSTYQNGNISEKSETALKMDDFCADQEMSMTPFFKLSELL